MLGERQPSLFDRDYDGKGLGPLKKGEPSAAERGDRLVLYTPNTGLPDLELKIAYGLARVAFEAGLEFEVVRKEGWYEIRITSSKRTPKQVEDMLQRSFRGIVKRVLEVENVVNIITYRGDPTHFDSKQRKEIFEILRQNERAVSKVSENIKMYLQEPSKTPMKGGCTHPDIEVEGVRREKEKKMLIQYSNLYGLGKPKRTTGRKIGLKFVETEKGRLCTMCILVSTLGALSAQINISLPNKTSWAVLPTIRKVFDHKKFAELISTVKAIGRQRVPSGIPDKAVPIFLMSRWPSLFLVFGQEDVEIFIIAMTLSKSWQLTKFIIEKTNIMKFLFSDSSEIYNPFLFSFLKRMGKSRYDPKSNQEKLVYPAEELWAILADVIEANSPQEKRKLVANLLRNSTIKLAIKKEASKEAEHWHPYLIARPLAKTFLEGLMDVKRTDLYNLEIPEGEAIEAVAGVMRWFVEQRDFGFVNRLMSISEQDFSRFLAELERAACSQAVFVPEKNYWYLPQVNEKGEVIKDATGKPKHKHTMPRKDQFDLLVYLAEENFEEVKYSLVVSALSRWPQKKTKEEEK